MAGFDDLVEAAQPALCAVEAGATAGVTWQFTFEFRDNTGTPIDLSGLTATCLIYGDRREGTPMLQLTADCNADGTLVLSATNAETFLVTPSSKAAWACTLTRDDGGGDFTVVALWRTVDSPFPITTVDGS